MKMILIGPSGRPEMGLLSEHQPLSNTPLLGQGLLEYWLSHLACQGVKTALVLASDRPEQVQALVDGGSRWGMEVEVITETQELAPAQALAKYGPGTLAGAQEVSAVVLDRFPGRSGPPLFASYRQWFAALLDWMPSALTPDRVGVRQVRSGIWAGLHTHISNKAALHPPCWLGDHIYVGPGAVIGPGAILESGAFIESDAEIRNSCVGPDTFVGRYTRIQGSVAWGSTLIDWQTGLESKVSEAFLLCSLRQPDKKRQPAPWLERLVELWSRWTEEPSVSQETILQGAVNPITTPNSVSSGSLVDAAFGRTLH